MKGKVLVAALLVASTLLLAASAAGAQRADSVTLKLLTSDTIKPAWDVMIGNFERAYPNIHIDVSYVPGGQIGTLLSASLQAGNPPDVFTITSGSGSIYSVYALGSQGKLLDLTGSPWVKRVPRSTIKLTLVKRRAYAFQTTYSPEAVMYNTDLFKSLGLKIPTTFSDLLALCRTISAAGKIPIAFGAASLNAPQGLSTALGLNDVYGVDPLWNAKRLAHKTTFASSPLWQHLVQHWADLKDAGCYEPAPQAVTANTQYAMVANEQAVMMIAAGGELPPLRALNPNIHMGAFALPAVKAKDTRVELITSQAALAAYASTAHPKEAKTFIDFVARPKQNTLFNNLAGGVSGDDFAKGIVPDWAQTNLAPLAKAGRSAMAPSYTIPFPQKALWNPFLNQQLIGLFTGQTTPQGVLAAMDAKWDGP